MKKNSTTNMDNNNKIPKKQIEAKTAIYQVHYLNKYINCLKNLSRTSTLLALKKIKAEPKEKKKTKPKVKIEGDMPKYSTRKKKRKKGKGN